MRDLISLVNNNSKLRFYAICGLLFAVLIFGGCLWSANINKTTNKVNVENLKVGVFKGEFSSLIYLADEKGFFKDNGLNVELSEYDSGVKAVLALLNKEVDVADGAEFVAVSNINGKDLRIFSAINSISNAIRLIAKKDKIFDVTSLVGKKIGIKSKSQAEFFMGSYLTLNLLKADDIKLIDIDPSAMSGALKNNQLDGVVVWDPFASNIEEMLGADSFVSDVQSGRDFYFLTMTRQEIIKEKPEVLKKFLSALIQAESFAKQHNDQAKEAVKNRLGYDQEYIDKVWPHYGLKVFLPQTLLVTMEDEAKWLGKGAGGSQLPNYLDFIDYSILGSLDNNRVTIIR
jgi:NitT/TauT family transport system substrate-binding protein